MSQWTHVNGNVRLDSLRHAGHEQRIKTAFGPAWGWKDGIPEDERVPYGSEGSIQYSVTYTGYQDGNSCSIVCCNVTLWGDLRDFGIEGLPVIMKWLQAALDDLQDYAKHDMALLYPRSFVVVVEVESGPTYLLTVDDGKVVAEEIQNASANRVDITKWP